MPFSDKEPDNYIYPLLSKRKFVNYNVLVSQEIVSKVDDTFNNIIGKVDNLTNPSMLAHRKYQEKCKDILGFDIFSYQVRDGKNAGYFYKDDDMIKSALSSGLIQHFISKPFNHEEILQIIRTCLPD